MMKGLLLRQLIVATAVVHSATAATSQQQQQPQSRQTSDGKPWNILFIAVDDLRPQLACMDAPGTVRPTGGMHTPHLCGLANESLVLDRSQVSG